MDGQWRRYVNQYRTSALALSKQQLAEERDKRRYLSYKFSVLTLSSREFSWPSSIYGDVSARIEALRGEFLRLEASLPAAFLHSAWRSHSHCERWIRAVCLCTTPRQFALALSILVTCMKPVIFRSIWHDAVGKYVVSVFLLFLMLSCVLHLLWPFICIRFFVYLARSANLPTGLYILLALISFFFF